MSLGRKVTISGTAMNKSTVAISATKNGPIPRKTSFNGISGRTPFTAKQFNPFGGVTRQTSVYLGHNNTKPDHTITQPKPINERTGNASCCASHGRGYRVKNYLIIAFGISKMIAGKLTKMATLIKSTTTNQPHPLKMSPIFTLGATPFST